MAVKRCPVSVKVLDSEEELGQFEAIVSVFGNKDMYGDVVKKGAFKDTLADWKALGDPIPVYWSHRMDDPDYNIGYVLDAKEVDKGLWVRGQLDQGTPKADQVWRLLKGGRVRQFSFAYDVDEGGYVKSDEHGEYFELRKLTLHEVGPTPLGANPDTELLTVKTLKMLAARVAVDGAKAGRVLSAANEKQLRAAYESIGVVLSALDQEEDGKARPEPAKIEESPEAKSPGTKIEEPMRSAADTRLSVELLTLGALG